MGKISQFGSPQMVIPESTEIIDSAGDVHVNRFYNQTRNTNLSIASKMTVMSEHPIKSSIDSTMTYKTTMSQNASTTSTTDAAGGPKQSGDITWDDEEFSDQ